MAQSLRTTPLRAARSITIKSEPSPSPARSSSRRKPTTRTAIKAGEDDEDTAGEAASLALAKSLASYAYAGRTTRSASKASLKRPASPSEDSSTTAVGSTSTPVLKRVRTKSETASPSPSKKQKPIQMSLAKPHPAPPRWKEQYLAVREMRSKLVAAVDTMGCDRPLDRDIDPKSRRLTILISLMLSSQTKDETTSAAVDGLARRLGGMITLEGLLGASDELVQEAICKVGFWRRKTVYIRQSMEKLRDEFDGDVPKTVDDLCSLPGVGPKMAFLCLQAAWDINVGIGVDTHVHRITNRLGWHKPPTTTPEQTRLNLQSWLPSEYHAEINPMLVGFGQALCYPVGPRCDLCILAEKKLCPSRSKVGKVEGRREVVWKKEEGAEVKVEVEEIGELEGRREVVVDVPGEGSAEVDVKAEEGEEKVDEIVEEVEKAAEGKEVTDERVKEALDW